MLLLTAPDDCGQGLHALEHQSALILRLAAREPAQPNLTARPRAASIAAARSLLARSRSGSGGSAWPSSSPLPRAGEW